MKQEALRVAPPPTSIVACPATLGLLRILAECSKDLH